MVVLLVVILAVTSTLTYHAQSTARAQQRLVNELVIVNANFAAARYVEQIRAVNASLHKVLFGEIVKTEPLSLARDFPVVSISDRHAQQCQCDPFEYIQQHFAYDFTTREIFTKLGELSEKEKDDLRDALLTTRRAPLREGWQFALVRVPGSSEVFSYAVRVVQDTIPLFAIGFKATDDFLRLGLMRPDSFNLQLILDPRLPRSADRFSILARSGDKVLIKAGTPAGEAREYEVGPPFGDYKVQVWVNAKYHGMITGAPIPQPRIPFLIGLFTLASLLTVMALVVLRRQSQLTQLRSEFVANVSHELRTPLAQIRMFTETLMLGRVRNEAERKRSLEIIDQETRRLSVLVENVLQLGRSERGAVTLAPAAIELAPTVREVIESFAQLPRSGNVEFRQELESRLVATVDPGAFRQILLNLLDNAVKYGPAGQRVHVGLAMFEEHARLWVDDEGPGIPRRERQRVFEPFYRSPEHVTRSIAGSGIGLAIVRELARLLGGTAWAEDAPGGGARLIVEFPHAYLRADEAAGGMAVA